MKLRDLWPALLTSPLLLFPIAEWSSEQQDLAGTIEVDGHITRVQKYQCYNSRYRKHCYELTVAYKAADGREHQALKYKKLRVGAPPRVGDHFPVLVNTSAGGSISDGSDTREVAGGMGFITMLALGMFALGCYSSWTRIKRRRASSLAPPA